MNDRTKMIVEKATQHPTYNNLKKARLALAAEKRKKEVKEEFEQYLRESMNSGRL